ncbi:hypothetical protein EVAR_34018_1 [Eumeta japonica]|uniref:Uncharacterized protein n=1 Tax=Eumeta variegata TaxID=151549 RepID=A0A4C1VUT5_EUMVA|nr:hypothetical protein EVAR_34018_1 [Eumeta japonica]
MLFQRKTNGPRWANTDGAEPQQRLRRRALESSRRVILQFAFNALALSTHSTPLKIGKALNMRNITFGILNIHHLSKCDGSLLTYLSESSGSGSNPLHHSTPPSLRCAIPAQNTDNVLVTPWGLRVFMSGGDQLHFGGWLSSAHAAPPPPPGTRGRGRRRLFALI